MARKKVKKTKKAKPPVEEQLPSEETPLPPGEATIAGLTMCEANVYKGRILNCVPSASPEADWTIDTAIQAGDASASLSYSPRCDLRATWWRVRNQRRTGACVGFAAADGVLRWHYHKAGMIRSEETSPRFIWMANKETDDITSYPTTFIESTGTQTKYALRIARRYGCVLERHLPMVGGLYTGSSASFYSMAARFRIRAFYNLGRNLSVWRYWICRVGPILTRLNCDRAWMNASRANPHLRVYPTGPTYGGHAVALVAYTSRYFIVRNSWGTTWGDRGFAYAWDAYAGRAFTEAYGVVL